MKILFYELNEVPWRLIDAYIKTHPESTLGQILENSLQLTTITKDQGELHPWTTWPTLHRGVYNDQHKICFLNQEIVTSFNPHWKFLAQAGLKVGVFGSLQSWPVPKTEPYAFYVPDTFASDAQTHPRSLELFQTFNLNQTSRDGGKTPEKISLSLSLIKDVIKLIQQGTSLRTLILLAGQLLRERLNPLFRSRRSIFQAPVAFDFFYRLIKDTQPDFATFFTNHVAGMMHRYWKYAFPEDFSYKNNTADDDLKCDNVFQAMRIADRQVKMLKEFSDQHNYTLMIASSMGQEAIDRGLYAGELRLENFQVFYEKLGFNKPIFNHLAMQPDFAFSFDNTEDLNEFRNRVSQLKTLQKKSLFTFKESGLTLNCNMQSSPDIVLAGAVLQGDKKISFKDLGIQIEMRDQGTAYHIPEGIWIVYKQGLEKDFSRKGVESVTIAPTILKLFNVKKPAYMKDENQEVIRAILQ